MFFILFITGATLLIPFFLMSLAGGVLYGPILGTIINLTGATIGATIPFLIARYLASSWLEKKAEGKLKTIKTRIEKEGWKFVAFTRLVPLFPYNFLNYAFGLTKIGLLPYIFSTLIFMFPACIIYSWLGYLGEEAIKGQQGNINKILASLAVLGLLILIPKILNVFKKMKERKIESTPLLAIKILSSIKDRIVTPIDSYTPQKKSKANSSI